MQIRRPATEETNYLSPEGRELWARSGESEARELASLHAAAVQNVLLAVTNQPLVPGSPNQHAQELLSPSTTRGGKSSASFDRREGFTFAVEPVNDASLDDDDDHQTTATMESARRRPLIPEPATTTGRRAASLQYLEGGERWKPFLSRREGGRGEQAQEQGGKEEQHHPRQRQVQRELDQEPEQGREGGHGEDAIGGMGDGSKAPAATGAGMDDEEEALDCRARRSRLAPVLHGDSHGISEGGFFDLNDCRTQHPGALPQTPGPEENAGPASLARSRGSAFDTERHRGGTRRSGVDEVRKCITFVLGAPKLVQCRTCLALRLWP